MIVILNTIAAFLAFMALKHQNMEIPSSLTPNWPKNKKKYIFKHVSSSSICNVPKNEIFYHKEKINEIWHFSSLWNREIGGLNSPTSSDAILHKQSFTFFVMHVCSATLPSNTFMLYRWFKLMIKEHLISLSHIGKLCWE